MPRYDDVTSPTDGPADDEIGVYPTDRIGLQAYDKERGCSHRSLLRKSCRLRSAEVHRDELPDDQARSSLTG